MPIAAHRRRDISDSIREKPDPRLPDREGSWGGGARDNRRLVNAVFRVMRAGAPPDPGGWSGTTRRRCTRWRDNDVRERPPEIPIDEPAPAWPMIDAGHCGVHPHAGGRERRQSGHDPRKRGSTQNCIWLRIVHGMPVRAFVTQCVTADCARAIAPIDGFAAERLLADKGHNRDEILARAEKQGMEAVIPPKKSRWHPSARLSSFR